MRKEEPRMKGSSESVELVGVEREEAEIGVR